ncbi:MAG TPA: hypothetical protein VFF39_08310, partial [Verrucomicrobiae bacterium]|nr:hypothetical protein [Verrucomicrobiae bacterium]
YLETSDPQSGVTIGEVFIAKVNVVPHSIEDASVTLQLFDLIARERKLAAGGTLRFAEQGNHSACMRIGQGVQDYGIKNSKHQRSDEDAKSDDGEGRNGETRTLS